MQDLHKKLIEVTAPYFDDNLDYYALSNATKAYKELLLSIVNEELDTLEKREDIHFNNGKALGTFWAAMCLDDIMRTRQFIRGVQKAIEDKVKDKQNIRVLYAGTGPFATLVLPLMVRYPKEKIFYDFVEINPKSLNILKRVIKGMKLKDYTITYQSEDASNMSVTNVPDIIISETMQRALDKEQLVSIYFNLMQQSKPDTVFIPEKIQLTLTTDKSSSSDQLVPKDYVTHDHLFELSKKTLEGVSSKFNFEFPKHETVIKKDAIPKNAFLNVNTKIQVYKNEILEGNQSGLTIPKILPYKLDECKKKIIVHSQYVVSDNPELKIEVDIF